MMIIVIIIMIIIIIKIIIIIMKIKLHSPLTNSSGFSTEAERAELELEWSTR